MKMFLVEPLLNLVIYVRNKHSKTQKHRFAFITISIIVANDTRIHVIERSPQNTDDQHWFSVPCLFVLISHHFIPLTKIEAEAAKKLRTSLGKIYWFLC